MAVLYITEFNAQGMDQNARQINITCQPPVHEQTVATSATSAQSATFQNNTSIVRLHNDSSSAINILFGTNPTAVTSTNARMAANQTEYFFIPQTLAGQLKVAAVTVAL